MSEPMTPLDDAGTQSRRSLLRGAVPAAAAIWLRPSASRAEPATEDDRIAEVQAKGKAAGLGPFRVSRAERFLGVGDAPDAFRQDALEICAALGRLFLSDLRARGFKLGYPNDRLMVVVLKDSRSYEALLGEAPGIDVGGHFDLNSNRLVIFDFRPGREETPGAERMNTFTLVHETAHLLSFNTGLLSLDREPPKCLAEGLATCFEMWRPRIRAGVAAINGPRLQAIRDAGETWIDADRLVGDDGLFDREETAQLAYGQSWMLVYSLLKDRADQPKLKAWLEEIRASGPPVDRLATAEKHLGSLDELDERLKRESRALLKGLPAR